MLEGGRDDGFHIIWLYWVKRYMSDKLKGKENIPQVIAQLKRYYTLQSIEGKQKIELKTKQIHSIKSSISGQVYVIDPEKQLKHIEEHLKDQYQTFKNQIYSYYLNTKTVFIIYCNDWQGSENLSSKGDSAGDHNDNISQGPKRIKVPIRQTDNRTEGNKSNPLDTSSLINNIFHSCNEYESSQCRNDESLCETVEIKIDQLEMLNKIATIDGLEIFDCKYKNIPHCFLRFKKDGWKQCLQFKLVHPAQPKLISGHPIIPKIQPFQPGEDKLTPFVSYIKLLDKYHPGYMPSKESIFQSNGMPYVLCRQENNNWNEQTNIGLLCYYVVYGEQQGLTTTKVQKWAQQNSNTLLGKYIKQMNKRHRERRKNKKQSQIRPLVFYEDLENTDIW